MQYAIEAICNICNMQYGHLLQKVSYLNSHAQAWYGHLLHVPGNSSTKFNQNFSMACLQEIPLLFLWPNTYFAHSNTILAFTRISMPPKLKRCSTEIHDPHETGQNQLWGFHLTSFFSVKQAPWGKRYIICSPFESMFSLLTVSNNWGSNLVSISSFWQLCIDCMVAMVSWWPAPCRVKLVSGGALMSSLSCSPRPSRCHTHKQEKDCQRLCSG